MNKRTKKLGILLVSFIAIVAGLVSCCKTIKIDDMDLDIIRNNFTQFKEDVNSMINDVHEESNRKLDELETAVKNYKDIINSKFDDIENKQTHYIKLLKQILQKSKDETTIDLVQKYLIDDKHI